MAALIYTSGTTGLPKGVMLSHRNLLFLAAGSAKIRTLTPDDRLYGILPMSHAVGLSVVLLGSLLSGATLYLSPRFDPMTARVTLEKERLTVMLGAPATFNSISPIRKVQRDRVAEISRASNHFFFRRSAPPLDQVGDRRAFSACRFTTAMG